MTDRKQWIAIAGFIVLALATAACCLPGIGRRSSPPVLFEDDFSSPSSGWEQGDYDTGTVGYEGGTYAVSSIGGGNTMWGVAHISLSDVTIRVKTAQVSAPDNDNNSYGVVCREQGEGSGYYLLISGDGGFAIFKADTDGFEPLVDWAPTDAVRQGNTENVIEATCNGSLLTLIVNGTRVATAEDHTFSRGDVALTVTSYEHDQSSTVHFDNIVIARPTDGGP
jgi:hypothetical protein